MESKTEQVSEAAPSKEKTNYFQWTVIILLIGITIPYITTIIYPIINLIILSICMPHKDSILQFNENPLKDVELIIPVRFASEFNFPDLFETTEIQIDARTRQEFFTLPMYKVKLINGSKEEYLQGKYPEDDLFVNSVLSSENGLQVDGMRNYGEIYFSLDALDSNDFPFFLTQLIIDHAFRDELEKYSPDNYYVSQTNDKNTFINSIGYSDFPIINSLVDSAIDDKPVVIRLKFFIAAADLMNVNMQSAVEEYLLPLFEEFKDYIKFEIYFATKPMNNPNPDFEMEEIDDYFPTELTDLAELADIYKQTKKYERNEDGSFDIHFVLYPFLQGGEKIKSKTVDGKPLYSTIENSYLSIDDWGSIYFSHIPDHSPLYNGEVNDIHEFSKQQLKDCMWTFTEALLDFLHVPCESLSTKMRIKIFQRYLTVQNIVRSAHDVYYIPNAQSLRKLRPDRFLGLIEKLDTVLELRQETIDLLKADQTKEALKTSRKMLSLSLKRKAKA